MKSFSLHEHVFDEYLLPLQSSISEFINTHVKPRCFFILKSKIYDKVFLIIFTTIILDSKKYFLEKNLFVLEILDKN